MSLIVLIIIVAVVISASQKKEQSKGKGTKQKYDVRSTQQSNTITGTNVVNNSKAMNTEMRTEKAAVQEKKQNSTTEYLNRKAAEDHAAHMEEKRKQAEKHQQIYGDDKIGEMYVEGDLIAPGKIRVTCPYCNADNLILSRYRANSRCYFCRTKL